MQHFDSDGVDIAFTDIGAGDPILLIHGFGTTALINWVKSGWAEELAKTGRRVIAIDNRGHGESAKLYDPAGYRMPEVAEDARRLLDHLGIQRADIMGYSMGSRIAALIAVRYPERVRSLILGGMGKSLVEGMPPAHAVADALEADSVETVEDEKGRMFRQFAERTRGDLRALAACMRSPREAVDAHALRGLSMPILVAIGTNDTIAGPISELAVHLPGADLYEIVDRDHMRAVGDAAYRQRVLAFLEQRS